jgi:hypothetical protein
MRFTKIRDGQGDYNSYDTGLLYEELTAMLGPAEGRWQLLNTDHGTQRSFDVVALDPTVDLSGVSALVAAHGVKTWEQREQEKLDREHNARVDQELLTLDQRAIRPLIELLVGTAQEKQVAQVKLQELYNLKSEKRATKK